MTPAPRPSPPPQGRPPLVGRVLVDLPNWVGDQVMAMPSVARVVEAAASCDVVLLAPAAMVRLLAAVFPAAAVVPRRHRGWPVSEAVRICRHGRFDVGITFRHASRAKILVRLAARRTVGSEGRGAGVLIDVRYRVDRRRHQLLDPEPMLERLGLGPVDRSWRLRLPAAAREAGRRRLGSLSQAAAPIVGLAPASGCGEAKRWPAEKFGALVASLPEDVVGWVVLGGPGEDRLAAEVAAAAGRRLPVVGVDGDVAVLAETISAIDALVCNDSGPMHLAAFQEVPVIALFGPTDPARTGPVGGGHRILRTAIECAPCRQPGCAPGHHRCLGELPVERVASAVVEVVGRRTSVVARPPAVVAGVSPAARFGDGGGAPVAAWPAPPARAAGRRG